MPTIDVMNYEPRKELSNHWQHIVGNVVAPGAANKKCWAFVLCFFRTFEGEVSQFAQTRRQRFDRDPKSEQAALRGLDKIGHEELSDRQGLANADR